MGCTFDCFSQTWSTRSYLITLVVIAWACPLGVILNYHLGMLFYLRKANIQKWNIRKYKCRRKRLTESSMTGNDRGPEPRVMIEEESSCGDIKCFSHIGQRVRSRAFLAPYSCHNSNQISSL